MKEVYLSDLNTRRHGRQASIALRMTTMQFMAGSEAEVRAAIASLPISQAGMLELVALVPLEPYPGFGAA
jgi:hypothetical protein